MTGTTQYLISHGVPLVFGAVLVEQMGLPLPAMPWLLAAGALSATGHLSFLLSLEASVVACLVADSLWFYLGRHRGSQVLGLLCRMSLEPDACIRRTMDVYARYGMKGVVFAKFLPGMGTLAPPLAGMSGARTGRFLLFDALGSLVYCGSLLSLGFLFKNQLARIGAALAGIGGSALILLAALAATYIVIKYWRRQRLLRELRMARITVGELRLKQDAGEKPVILDLRSDVELASDPSIISGAVHVGLNDIDTWHHGFPHDQDIILCCSCPNEVTSARVALLLRRKGFTRVRPLLGGIDAWRKSSFPMEVRVEAMTLAANGGTTRQ
jgi:membrane protein DedA with SNARE-associated domain/rhodanese-related sulfurtransferase